MTERRTVMKESPDVHQYLTLINEWLGEAAEIARRHYGNIPHSVKEYDANQVLTAADIEIGRRLTERIMAQFPSHNIIDEELGVVDHKSRFTWVVDPIDGTSNFAAVTPHFGSMIGLLYDDQPLAGGIVLPLFQQTYLAGKNLGCAMNGQPVSVTKEARLANVLAAYGIDGHATNPHKTAAEVRQLARFIDAIRNLRTTNSVYDQAMVASGHYGITANQTSRIWDNVAQQIIIEEAGGLYTDIDGQPIQYTQPLAQIDTNFSWLAGAAPLHEQALRALHANPADTGE